MEFGEEHHGARRLREVLDRARAKYRVAPWEKVALVREEVALLLAHEGGYPKLRMMDGELTREPLWAPFDRPGKPPRPKAKMPKYDGLLYLFAEHPAGAMVEIEAAVARGIDFTGADLYFTPVERRSWVWIQTYYHVGPFLIESPETKGIKP